MSACVEVLTLNQLKEINNINVDIITQEVALDICDQEKENHESGLEMLCLWTKKLHKFYGLSNLSTANWTKLVEILEYVLKKMLSEAPDEKNNLAVELESWLQECHDFLQTASKKLKLINLNILLNFMLHTLVEFSGFHEKWNKNVNLKTHIVEVLKLHDLILQLINANMEDFDLKNEQQRLEFVKINELLCMFAAQSKLTGVKTIVETWKCVVRLVNFSMHSPLKNIVVERPVRFLLLEVGRTVEMIYHPEALNRPLSQIEKYLRVTNFYLGLLKRIATDFQHEEFPAIEEFFAVYKKVCNVPDFIMDTAVARILKVYVLTDFQEILKIVFQHECFSKLLLKNVGQLPLGIIQDYLHVCISEGDGIFLNDQTSLCKVLFENSFTDVNIFVNDYQYSSLLEYFAVIAMTNAAFSLYIRKNVLQSHNFLILHASLEVILCVTNSLEPEQCVKELRYWNKWNARYSVFSTQLNAYYVQWLLSYMFKLCQECGQARKLPTLQKPNNAKDYRSLMLWVQQQNKTIDSSNDVLQILNNNNTYTNLDVYYNAAMCMSYLVCATDKVLHKVISILLPLLDNTKRFVVFEDAAFKLLSKHVDEINYDALESLLKKLQQQLPHNMSPSVAMLNFLCACAQNYNSQQLSKSIIRNIVHLKWCSLRCKSSETVNNDAIINIKKLLQEANFITERHECPEILEHNGEFPKHKRPRFLQEENNEEEEDNFIDILKNIYDRSKDILKTERKLYTEEVQLVCGIVENFQSVLQKNFD